MKYQLVANNMPSGLVTCDELPRIGDVLHYESMASGPAIRAVVTQIVRTIDYEFGDLAETSITVLADVFYD